MLLKDERELIIECGINLRKANLIKDTSGNISIFNREKKLIAITPSGIDYFEIKQSDIVIMNLRGEVVEGEKKPSSEVNLHKIFYERRDDIDAMIHTHSIYSTIIACLNWDLPPVHYMLASAGKDVRCAKYATFGTNELAENAYDAMIDRKAVLLANHGVIVGAKDLGKAYSILKDVEFCAEVYYRCKSIGEPIVLSNDEMENMIERFKTYGQPRLRHIIF